MTQDRLTMRCKNMQAYSNRHINTSDRKTVSETISKEQNELNLRNANKSNSLMNPHEHTESSSDAIIENKRLLSKKR